MNVETPVSGRPEPALAGVNADSNAKRRPRQRGLSSGRGGYCVMRRRECNEERVACGIDLDAVVGRPHLAQQSVVLGEKRPVRITVVVDKPGRPFDVGEEEGDVPFGEHCLHRRS